MMERGGGELGYRRLVCRRCFFVDAAGAPRPHQGRLNFPPSLSCREQVPNDELACLREETGSGNDKESFRWRARLVLVTWV